MANYNKNRTFMKSSFLEGLDIGATADISQGIPQPLLQKTNQPGATTISLPEVNQVTSPKTDFFECLVKRRSRRVFTNENLSQEELAFLLWCTQGIKQIIPGSMKYTKGRGQRTLRPVPSGGAIHPYETYLAISHIEAIEPGIWRYLPLSHQLLRVREEENVKEAVSAIFSNPDHGAQAAVVFLWACTPYRGEWRYQHTSHKVMLLDAGHICQNLYLAVEAIGAGCCAIAGYYQDKADALVGVDGQDEYVVYCATVGRI